MITNLTNPSDQSSNAPRSVRRLLPEEPLPPYAFVPGRHPHPESDPAGHSFGRQRIPAELLDSVRWSTSRPYLFGIDLFNEGFYWESHVEFESLWLAAGRKGTTADFLKGLIHLAAAGVKHLEGKPDGVKSHSARAAELWQNVTCDPSLDCASCFGFSLEGLRDLAQSIHGKGWPETRPLLEVDLP
jgi:uncharacterized protein